MDLLLSLVRGVSNGWSSAFRRELMDAVHMASIRPVDVPWLQRMHTVEDCVKQVTSTCTLSHPPSSMLIPERAATYLVCLSQSRVTGIF